MASTGEAGRVPALDGLRGVAVGLVLVGHYLLVAPLNVPRDAARAFGDLGVTAFFVLSGWLITSILLRELGRTGRISIRDFYRRRTLRIFPALYAFLAGMALLTVVGVVDLEPLQLLLGASFTMNYAPVGADPAVLHLWSLAVEEQFYLLWPALLIVLRPRRAFVLAVAVVVALPMVRDVLPGDPARITVYLHTRGDSLMVGALAALLPVVVPGADRVVRFVVGRPWVPVMAGVVLAWSLLMSGQLGIMGWLVPWGWTLNSVAVVVLILAIRDGSRSVAVRALEARWLVRLGVISYSVYLWQQLFLEGSPHPVFVTWPVGIVAAVVAGWLSYRWVETPFLRLKDRQRGTRVARSYSMAVHTAAPAAPVVEHR